MKRIGIFGGSFNPVHIGHLIVAQDAVEECQLDSLVFVPCYSHSLKSSSEYVEANHRLEMVKACTADSPCFTVSPIEINRREVSYTIDTAREFQKDNLNDEIYILSGSDAFCDILKWKDFDGLLKEFNWIVAWREGHEDKFKRLLELATGVLCLEALETLLRTQVVRRHDISISSTEIRNRVRDGKSIKYLVPTLVEDYIYEKKLFKQGC